MVGVGHKLVGFVSENILKLLKLSMHGHDDVMSSHPIEPLDFRGLVSEITSIRASSLYLKCKKFIFLKLYLL